MNWFWANKEWLFSGIGVALLGGLYAYFSGAKRGGGHSTVVSADRQSSVTGSPAATGSNISQIINIGVAGSADHSPSIAPHHENPTPPEIHAQLNSLPLFQREQARDSYRGLGVRWPVTLLSVDRLSEYDQRQTGENYRVLMMFADRGDPIGAEVDIERFPRLKISHRGTPFQISGTISSISDLGVIRLQDVEIVFG